MLKSGDMFFLGLGNLYIFFVFLSYCNLKVHVPYWEDAGSKGKRRRREEKDPFLEKVRLISLCSDLHGYDRRATNVVGFQGRGGPRLEENSRMF